MAKYCPVCGVRFPNYANVCDQHGVPLRRRVRHWWVLGAALIAAPFALWMAWRWEIRATVEQARLEKGTGESAAEMPAWLAGKRLRLVLRLENGSALPFSAAGGSYELLLDGVQASVGSLPENMELRRGAPLRVEAAVVLDEKTAARLIQDQGTAASIRGTTNVRFLGVRLRTPFERSLRLKARLAADGAVDLPHH